MKYSGFFVKRRDLIRREHPYYDDDQCERVLQKQWARLDAAQKALYNDFEGDDPLQMELSNEKGTTEGLLH